MSLIETMMRAMTHLNIGAAIAMFAWILWSGYVIVQPDASRGSPARPALTGAASTALLPGNEASEEKP